ncbi:MAG: hypothetical protein ACOYON_03995 [Fimbriimonas sp.]
MRKQSLIGFALLALTGVAIAMPAIQEFTLKFVTKKDEVVKYTIKADVEVSGTQASFTGKVIEKTTEVKEDGTYSIETSNAEGKVVFGGQEMEMPAQAPTVTVYKANGDLAEIRGEGADGGAYRMTAISMMRWPGKAVKVGDEWTSEWKSDTKTGIVAGKATLKVLGEEKVGDWDCLKISLNSKETEGDTPAGNEGIYWVAKEDGKTCKLETKWKNAPFPGAPGPIDAKVTQVREK